MDDAVRQALEVLARTGPAWRRTRARVIVALEAGLSKRNIAQQVGASRPTVIAISRSWETARQWFRPRPERGPGSGTPLWWNDPEAREQCLRAVHEVVRLFRDAPGTRHRTLRPLELAEELRARIREKSTPVWSVNKSGVSRATWFRIQRANYLRNRDRAGRRPRRPWHLTGPSIVGAFAAYGASGAALCLPRGGRVARADVREVGRLLDRLNENARRPVQDPDEIETRLIKWLEVLSRHTPVRWETMAFLLGPAVLLPVAGVCHPVTGEPWPRLYAWAMRRRSVSLIWCDPEPPPGLFEYRRAREEQPVEGFDGALAAASQGGFDVLAYVLSPPTPKPQPSRKPRVHDGEGRHGDDQRYRWRDVLRRSQRQPPE